MEKLRLKPKPVKEKRDDQSALKLGRNIQLIPQTVHIPAHIRSVSEGIDLVGFGLDWGQRNAEGKSDDISRYALNTVLLSKK